MEKCRGPIPNSVTACRRVLAAFYRPIMSVVWHEYRPIFDKQQNSPNFVSGVLSFVWLWLMTMRVYTHDTCSRNRCRKLTPFSGADFRCQFFIPYASKMRIYATKIYKRPPIILIICTDSLRCWTKKTKKYSSWHESNQQSIALQSDYYPVCHE